MEDNLFDTPEKRNAAIADFTNLLTHPGWQLFEQIIEANVRVITSQLEDGIPNETKADVDRMRDKLKILRDMRDTPKTMIKSFQAPIEQEERLDPYPTLKEYQKEQAAR